MIFLHSGFAWPWDFDNPANSNQLPQCESHTDSVVCHTTRAGEFTFQTERGEVTTVDYGARDQIWKDSMGCVHVRHQGGGEVIIDLRSGQELDASELHPQDLQATVETSNDIPEASNPSEAFVATENGHIQSQDGNGDWETIPFQDGDVLWKDSDGHIHVKHVETQSGTTTTTTTIYGQKAPGVSEVPLAERSGHEGQAFTETVTVTSGPDVDRDQKLALTGNTDFMGQHPNQVATFIFKP